MIIYIEEEFMNKFIAIMLAILVLAVADYLLIASGLPMHTWEWWQTNIVETAYGGPNGMTPIHWWALPSLLVSLFGIPAIFLGGLALASFQAYLVTKRLLDSRT